MKKIVKLPQAELDIMNCLWDAQERVPRSYFNAKLKDKNWADSTVLTLLERLAEKGFVGVEKDGKRNIYFAKISKKDYLQVENKSFLSNLYGNSVKKMMASMVDTSDLSNDDIQDLQNLLEKLKK